MDRLPIVSRVVQEWIGERLSVLLRVPCSPRRAPRWRSSWGRCIESPIRAANVTGLLWSQVDLVRQLAWIHPDQAKARKAIPVPLNTDAVALISKQVGKHRTHVFSFKGTPIVQVSTKAWYAALERAEIVDFRWHDLRHTWASWHVQNGTPLYALQELGGWASTEMVRRYAHLAADHLAPYAQRLGEVRALAAIANGTNLSQAKI